MPADPTDKYRYQVLQPPTREQREAIKASIQRDGLLEPIVVDEEGYTLDGHTRRDICEELGIKYRKRVERGLSEEQKHLYAWRANIMRRQLSREDKIALAKAQREARRTQRQIADLLGVAQSTVSGWLGELIDRDELQQPDTVTGKDDKDYPTLKARRRVARRDRKPEAGEEQEDSPAAGAAEPQSPTSANHGPQAQPGTPPALPLEVPLAEPADANQPTAPVEQAPPVSTPRHAQTDGLAAPSPPAALGGQPAMRPPTTGAPASVVEMRPLSRTQLMRGLYKSLASRTLVDAVRKWDHDKRQKEHERCRRLIKKLQDFDYLLQNSDRQANVPEGVTAAGAAETAMPEADDPLAEGGAPPETVVISPAPGAGAESQEAGETEDEIDLRDFMP